MCASTANRWRRDGRSNRGLQAEAQTRIHDGISRIIANVEKQGGVVSPYLKNILPKAIGAKLIRKIQANPALQDQMHSLQRLTIGDASRQRRLAAIDRAVQQYLPDVAREELREAGVQIANAFRSQTRQGRRPDRQHEEDGAQGIHRAIRRRRRHDDLERSLRPSTGGVATRQSG